MRLTKQTNHAIRILIHCAGEMGQLVKVAEIAQQLDITPQNVFKIVHLLARAGFLKAMRGRRGGVQLARPPAEIRIGAVVPATETTRLMMDDETAAATAEDGAPPISQVLDSALEAFISVLDQHTLADMAKGVPGIAPANGRTVRKTAQPAATAKSRVVRTERAQPGTRR